MARLEMKLFGEMEVSLDGQLVEHGRRRRASVGTITGELTLPQDHGAFEGFGSENSPEGAAGASDLRRTQT